MPTRTRTDRRVQHGRRRRGSAADRGHTASVPHTPTGMHGGAGHGGQPGRTRLALQHGVEEGLARGGWSPGAGSPPPRRPRGPDGRRAAGASERLPRSTGMPPEGARHWPDDGRVEELALGQEAHGPAQPGGHDGQGHHVEVAAVVGGQDDRAARRDAVHAVDVEAGVGKQPRGAPPAAAGRRARARPPWAPPAGRSQRSTGQRRSRATACSRRSGFTAWGWPTAPSSGQVEHAVGVGVARGQVDTGARRPAPHGGQLARRPHELARRSPRCSGRRSRA